MAVGGDVAGRGKLRGRDYQVLPEPPPDWKCLANQRGYQIFIGTPVPVGLAAAEELQQ